MAFKELLNYLQNIDGLPPRCVHILTVHKHLHLNTNAHTARINTPLHFTNTQHVQANKIKNIGSTTCTTQEIPKDVDTK